MEIVTNRNKEKGFSLIELMSVLVIVVILAAGVVYGIGAAKGSANLSKAIDQTAKIAKSAEIWRAANNNANYTGISMAALAATLGNSAKLASPWGGVYSIAVNGNTAKFDISFTADSDVSGQVAANLSNTAVGVYVTATKTVTITAP